MPAIKYRHRARSFSVMPYLELHGQKTARHELDEEVTVVGRSLECRVILEGASISRKHAQITRVGTNFFVQDLESRCISDLFDS